MTGSTFNKSHWQAIDPDRMASYRAGFGWTAATEAMFARFDVADGQIIADFGG